MCNFNTLIFSGLILLTSVPKGSGLVCWKCNTESGGASDCDHPRESKELELGDRFGSPVCITVEYHHTNNNTNNTFVMRNILSVPFGTRNVEEDCAKPDSFFIKKGGIPADVKVDKCRICLEELCNLTTRTQSSICLVVIMGISSSLFKIYFSSA